MTFVDPISKTARLTAAARARETERPDRLFEDPWAKALAGPEGFALLRRWEESAQAPGATSAPENPYIAMRTRYFDDFLGEAVAVPEAGQPIRQVVIVAAGLDTRAFRLPWLPATRLFELDHPDVLAAKDRLLEAAGAVALCERTVVPADLTVPWADTLVAHGFDARVPAVWLIEGLFPYLDEAGARALLAEGAPLAAPGSRLAADFVGKSLLESPFARPVLALLERENVPWRFGTDEPEALLADFGWAATALRPGDPGMNFGRWPFPTLPRGTPGIPSSFLVTATRAAP
ncbi:MAG TPA: SAM-dependent methyltransferase [Polyangia bacterium]|jgi:methyltransferase (TIGR00027 family)